MFNLIYHLLPKNHKLSRCSSGRVSVDSAAFFGYKFGYKILNPRKPSGSAGSNQLTNNLRMDALQPITVGGVCSVRMDSPDIVRSCARPVARAWMGRSWRACVDGRSWARAVGVPPGFGGDSGKVFSFGACRHTPGGGASGKIAGGIAIQYIFARKIFGILANDNKRIKTDGAIGRISHIVVRWSRQGAVFTAPLIFSRG